MCNLFTDTLLGILAGIVSGILVYILTKKRERKQETFQFWFQYLFDALKYCDMVVPVQLAEHMWIMKDNNEWKEAIFAINDALQRRQSPESLEDRELTDDEIRVSENVVKALGLLVKWNKAL